MAALSGKHILLIIGGGIAAYKALELIRLLQQEDGTVDCVLTASGARFVTPLSLQAITGRPVHQDLWSSGLDGMGHIHLSRAADLLVVAPASADLLARMRAGLADDLATALLLAADTPILVAPAMNPCMWRHPATAETMMVLEARGVHRVGPEEGGMACGETGPGRLAEPAAIAARIACLLAPENRPLQGKQILVTSGPTREPIDPVRFLSNRSSGRQGHAIADALAALGAEVILVSGPVAIPPPETVTLIKVETAEEMDRACQAALPVDAAVCVAAVSDWRVAEPAAEKWKKTPDAPPPMLYLTANPDILARLSQPGPMRPRLVVGFAAETCDVLSHAQAKRRRKGCDWILANDVAAHPDAMGGAENQVHCLTEQGIESWPMMTKTALGRRLAARIAAALG